MKTQLITGCCYFIEIFHKAELPSLCDLLFQIALNNTCVNIVSRIGCQECKAFKALLSRERVFVF